MIFPKSQRYIYRNNPIDKVICQFRFPSILRIENQVPDEFQEVIREDFPLYEESIEGIMSLPEEIKRQLPAGFQSGNLYTKNYAFITADRTCKINLTKEFLALTCSNYNRWENFKHQFEKPLSALIEIYKPSFFTRLGLRYINIFTRSKLELNDEKWVNLLRSDILGILSIKEDNIINSKQDLVIQLSDNDSYLHIVNGLFTIQNCDEKSYVIDSDFFVERQIEIGDGKNVLDKFNDEARNLFQWCITEKLHTAMEPISNKHN